MRLASAVCAPIFLGVANTRRPNFSLRASMLPGATSVAYFRSPLSSRAFMSPSSSITSFLAVLTSVAPFGMLLMRS